MTRVVAAAIVFFLLSGCVGRPLKVACKDFASFVQPAPVPNIIKEIQSDAIEISPGLTFAKEDLLSFFNAFPVAQRQKLFGIGATDSLTNETVVQKASDACTPHDKPSLILSGGGQWGAFGAGFLRNVKWGNGCEMPAFQMITGISTGAMQALILGQGHDAATRARALGALTTAYTIGKETDVVVNSGFRGAVFKGAMANLSPLQKKIEAALCPNIAGEEPCAPIRALQHRDAPTVLIGFVEAKSGKFQLVVMNDIAKRAMIGDRAGEAARLKQSQQCLTGAVLASAAMPLYYQQVQVEGVTYYDGGVRSSILEALAIFVTSPESMRKFAKSLTDKDREALGVSTGIAKMTGQSGNPDFAAPVPTSAPLYIIRNGPTTAQIRDRSDDETSAITTALRGYSIIVNQSEVMSIAAIRLTHSKGPIYLATADGFDRDFPRLATADATKSPLAGPCRRAYPDMMFEPAFMQCLRDFGKYKAGKLHDNGLPWISISEIDR